MLRRKKLDSILSGFIKIQKQLEGYIEQVGNDLTANASRITDLGAERSELHYCRAKANTVSTNLSNLLGESYEKPTTNKT